MLRIGGLFIWLRLTQLCGVPTFVFRLCPNYFSKTNKPLCWCAGAHIEHQWAYKFAKIVESQEMSPRTNELLVNIPDREYELITENMKLVSLVKGQTLFEIGQIPTEVHYPVGAMVSMIIELEDGFSVETYMMGKSCMVGVGAVGVPSFYRAKVRSSGLAYRLSVDKLRQAWQSCPSYVTTSQIAIQRVFKQLSQSVICGKRHSVDQQLIRWMLTTLDRTLSDIIPITHQELSELLGFRREAVTHALGKLYELGLIACCRGQLTVRDRGKLEALSCDCYRIGRERLLA